jgi:NADH dehydrogenase
MTERGTVLVTGASGRIGAAVLSALGDSGWRCRALVHRTRVAAADEEVAGSLDDRRSLDAAVAGAAAVVHLAGSTHARRPAHYDAVNRRGTADLVAAAASGGALRFVLVSTRAIAPEGGAYSRSKAAAEAAVRASTLAWSIVRLPEVYGTGGEGVDDVIARAARGRRVAVVGDGDDVVCPIHVDDAAAACARALEVSAAVGQTYTLAGDCLTIRELAREAADVAGRRLRLVRVPVAAVRALSVAAYALPLPLYPDQLDRLRSPKPPPSSDAAADLRFRPRPLRAGLEASLVA